MKLDLLLTAVMFILGPTAQPGSPAEKPRLVILTDIGGDPDDQQSMIRLMLYSNEFDIEGLIASSAGTTGELKDEVVKPELIREIVEAYGKVRDNLVLHDPAFPPARQLLDRIKSGNPHRGVRSLGDEHDTEGSHWIIEAADRADARTLNIAIWGGSTELAQALWRVRHDRGADGLAKFVAKLRVYAINHQDDTGPWIIEHFPDVFYILSRQPEGRDKRESAYRGMYLGGDESLTSREWVDSHVRLGHGPLGALYPTRTWTEPNPHGTLKEGDTPSWFYFLPNGLSDPSHPEWGGWGGRFRHERGGLYRDATDTVGDVTDARATVWRWRPAFQADFQARMDWCVQSFAGANHSPIAGWRGDTSSAIVHLAANAGDRLQLDATGSRDTDGHSLRYRWWTYREASSYRGDVPLGSADSHNATLLVPSDAAGKTIHVILEVTDSGQPPLSGYRRVVLSVSN